MKLMSDRPPLNDCITTLNDYSELLQEVNSFIVPFGMNATATRSGGMDMLCVRTWPFMIIDANNCDPDEMYELIHELIYKYMSI